MDNAPMRLELVPMDDAAIEESPPASAPTKSSPTSSPVQRTPVTAEASLDAIDIRPVERAFPITISSASNDTYVDQASREHAQGRFDRPLWDRALAKSNGDTAAAAAMYISARAVQLRMHDRKRKESAKRAAAKQHDDPPVVARRTVWQRYRMPIVASAVLVSVAVAAAFFLMSGPDDAVAAAPARAPAAAAPAAPAAPPASSPPSAAEHEAKPAPNVALAQKVQELRDAGNFNVMVLHANEWTRKEPDNASAWDQLSFGYRQLRQYDDARSAAKTAVKVAPDDARLWRNLASINLDIDDPEAALAAYEQAAAHNSVDVESLNAIALLHARIGHPDQAKAAFDKAAAASPGDAVTACLRNGVAQMPPARDGYTLSRQIRAIDNRCHGKPDAVAANR